MPVIFVSYRRNDAAGHAGRLYDRLVERFGQVNVFKDLERTRPGELWDQALTDAIARSDALMVVIGRRWMSDARLDDPRDWVRREIAQALNLEIDVIPVLVDGASLPRKDVLPGDIKQLAGRQAVSVSDADWNAGMSRLFDALDGSVATASFQLELGPELELQRVVRDLRLSASGQLLAVGAAGMFVVDSSARARQVVRSRDLARIVSLDDRHVTVVFGESSGRLRRSGAWRETRGVRRYSTADWTTVNVLSRPRAAEVFIADHWLALAGSSLRRWNTAGNELPGIDLGAPGAGLIDTADGYAVVDHGRIGSDATPPRPRLTRVDPASGAVAGALPAAPQLAHFSTIEKVLWGKAVLADDANELAPPHYVCGAGWPPTSFTSPAAQWVYPRAVAFVRGSCVAWLQADHVLVVATLAGAVISKVEIPGMNPKRATDILAYDGDSTLVAGSTHAGRARIVRLVPA